MDKKKDDTILIRINSEDKKAIKIRAIEKGFKNLSEYIMYCCMREISESELINSQMKDNKYQK